MGVRGKGRAERRAAAGWAAEAAQGVEGKDPEVVAAVAAAAAAGGAAAAAEEEVEEEAAEKVAAKAAAAVMAVGGTDSVQAAMGVAKRKQGRRHKPLDLGCGAWRAAERSNRHRRQSALGQLGRRDHSQLGRHCTSQSIVVELEGAELGEPSELRGQGAGKLIVVELQLIGQHRQPANLGWKVARDGIAVQHQRAERGQRAERRGEGAPRAWRR